MTKNDGVF